MYERPHCQMLVFRKGTLSLAKLLLDSILHCFIQIIMTGIIENLNLIAFMH